jgi:hypothetical protein
MEVLLNLFMLVMYLEKEIRLAEFLLVVEAVELDTILVKLQRLVEQVEVEPEVLDQELLYIVQVAQAILHQDVVDKLILVVEAVEVLLQADLTVELEDQE